MEKEREEALQWFVDFANMDIKTIKPGDKAKLLVEAEEYLSPQKEIEAFEEILPHHKDRLRWPFKELNSKESPEYWSSLLNLQGVVREVFLQIRGPTMRQNGKLINKTFEHAIFYPEKVRIKVKVGIEKDPIRLIYFPLTESQESYLRFKVYRLLDGLPSHTIQKCPGCKKYFLNSSLRKKTFCSPRCMWRVNAEKRREELKEKYPQKYKVYLKKQREIMRQKYEKKQKAKGYKKVTRYKRKED